MQDQQAHELGVAVVGGKHELQSTAKPQREQEPGIGSARLPHPGPAGGRGPNERVALLVLHVRWEAVLERLFEDVGVASPSSAVETGGEGECVWWKRRRHGEGEPSRAEV